MSQLRFRTERIVGRDVRHSRGRGFFQWALVAGLGLTILLSQACGSDDGSGETVTGNENVVSVDLVPVGDTGEPLTHVDPKALDKTVETLKLRLGAIEATGSNGKVSRQGNTITVEMPESVDERDRRVVIDAATKRGNVEFRPVLDEFPTGPGDAATPITPRGDIRSDEEVVLAQGDDHAYRLGPIFRHSDKTLSGEAIEDATTGQNGQGDWVVNLVFRKGVDGIDLFNAAATACFNGDPICPAQQGSRGQLAIVLDGEVLTAPSINEATFSRDQIQISGSFDQERAQSVAVALRYGSLPLDLAPA